MVGWSAPSLVGWWGGALVGQKEAASVVGSSLGAVLRVGGYIGGALDGVMVGGTLGLQLFAITVLSSLSSLVSM